MLKPAVFELALHLQAGACDLDLHDDGCVGHPQQFCQHYTRLAKAKVIGLQSCQYQVRRFGFGRVCKYQCDAERIALAQIIDLDVNGAVRSFSQRLAKRACYSLRPGAQHNDFAAVLLLQLQCLFECVCIRLVDGVVQIALVNPSAISGNADLRIPFRHLLYRYKYLHHSPVLISDACVGKARAVNWAMSSNCGGASPIADSASRNIVLQNGQAVPTICAPVPASSAARTWLTRSPLSSPRKASPPPAPQQKLRSC